MIGAAGGGLGANTGVITPSQLSCQHPYIPVRIYPGPEAAGGTNP